MARDRFEMRMEALGEAVVGGLVHDGASSQGLHVAVAEPERAPEDSDQRRAAGFREVGEGEQHSGAHE